MAERRGSHKNFARSGQSPERAFDFGGRMPVYAFIAALGFGALYAETTFARTQSSAMAWLFGAVTFLVFAISFLLPPRLFRYTNADPAPRVMSQVVARASIGAGIVLALNALVGLMLADGVPLLEELYVYALVAILLFHGWSGAVASYVVYLQQTRQYNSNQLVAVLVLVTLMLLVLVLYFLAFDWAILRDASIHLRDLTLVTLVLLGYGRAAYVMAHH
jgi:hypothetical protein